MGHEISQFDIPDRQLIAGSAQAGMWSDIGKAKITHTIFGKAKVRVIREKDKILRTWLLAALAVTALAAAGWQGWIALQQSKLLAAIPPLSERISVSAPVFNPETLPPAVARSARMGGSESLIQTEIDSLVASPNRLPPRPSALISAKPAADSPVTAQPVITGKPQPTPPLANNGLSPKQTKTPLHPKSPEPALQSAAPAVSTTHAAQPAANKPAPVAPADPLSRKDTTKPLPAINNQPSDAANVEPEVNARGTAIIYVQPDNAKP